MSRNRVHLLKLLHVYVAISSGSALGFGYFATTDSKQALRFSIFAKLLVALDYHLRLDLRCLFTHVLHDLLRFYAEVRVRPGEFEFKARRGHQSALRLGGRIVIESHGLPLRSRLCVRRRVRES